MTPNRPIRILRALAILAIIVFHFFEISLMVGAHRLPAPALLNTTGGWGVSIFLIVSGLGLVKSWERYDLPSGAASSRDRLRGVGAFYGRRLRRIFPLFWFVAVPILVVSALAGNLAGQLWKLPFWLTGTNIVMPSVYWPLAARSPQWWYISLALQFYLLFPVLAWSLARWGPWCLVGMAVVVQAACFQFVGHLAPGHAYFLQGFIGCRMVEVCVGMVLGEALWHRRVGGLRLAALAVVPFLALAVLTPGYSARWVAEISVLIPIWLLLFSPLARLSNSRIFDPLVWLGTISFALYLAHWAIVWLVVTRWGDGPLEFAAALVAAVVVAAAFFYAFEWRRRSWPIRPAANPHAAASMLSASTADRATLQSPSSGAPPSSGKSPRATTPRR